MTIIADSKKRVVIPWVNPAMFSPVNNRMKTIFPWPACNRRRRPGKSPGQKCVALLKTAR